MKKNHSSLADLFLLALVLCALETSAAETFTWNVAGAGTHIWGTNVNWAPDTGYPGTNSADPAVADFQVDILTNQTIGIAKALGTAAASKDLIATLSVLKVGDISGSSSFTFNKGGANSSRIHFQAATGNALFEKRGDGSDTFSQGAFRLLSDLEVVFAGGSGSLTLTPAINEQTAGQQHRINVSGSGTLKLGGTATSDFGGGVSVIQSTLEINGDRRLGAIPALLSVSNILLGNGATFRANGTVLLEPNRGVTLISGGTVGLSTVAADHSLTIAGPVASEPFNPVALEILGPGTVELLGINTFAGGVRVRGGKLILTSNHRPTEGIIVSDGAGLGVKAVAAGMSPFLTSLALGEGGDTTLDLDVGTLAPSLVEGLLLQSLTPRGKVTINVAGTSLVQGPLLLVSYLTLDGDGFEAFRLGSLPPGVLAHLENGGSAIVLQVDAVVNSLTWSGTINSDWDVSQILNWNVGTAAYGEYGPTTNRQGDMVLFDDSAALTTVNLLTNVCPVVLTVNAANNYSLQGPGAISGRAILHKAGPGTLLMRTTNTFTGGSVLSNGVLQAGNDHALGTGLITLSGGTLASDSTTARLLDNALTFQTNATLGDAANTGALTFNGSANFSGAGRALLVNSEVTLQGGSTNGRLSQKLGPGALMVRGSNLWTGGATEVRNGLLTLDGNFVLGDALRVMADVDAGTSHAILTSGSSLLINLVGSNLRVGHESSSVTNGTNILDVSGAVTFISTSTAGNTQLGSDSRFAQLNLLSGGSIAARSIGLGTQTPVDGEQEVNFDGGRLTALATSGSFIQGLTRVTIRSGGLTVDSAGFTLDVAQPLLDGGGSGGLTKLGTGLLRLHGTNSYAGTTTVSQGRLAGTGIIAGPVVVGAGAEISAGTGTAILTINNTLALNGTYYVEVDRDTGSPASDRLVGVTRFDIAGPLTVVKLGTNALIADDAFDLFDAAMVSGMFTATNLPALDPGLAWDTSRLYADGTLRVVLAPNNPTLNPIVYTSSDITLSGTGGAPNTAFRVLSSTNVSAPLATWSQAGTGNYDSSGAFGVTLPVATGEGQRFYLIVSP